MNRRGPARRWSWLALAGLLAALFFFALLPEVGTRGEREVTCLMAAASLAWDGDLSYGREDYDRYVRLWEREPEALALATSAGGSKVGFGRPPVYAVVAAPFVRISPRWGPAVLNWLLLALAVVASALVLERAVGVWAPVWIALCVAGTTAFTLLPLPSPEVFRMAASALAWALVAQVMPAAGSRRPGETVKAAEKMKTFETNGRTVLRWSLVGSLLVLAVMASVDGFCLLPALPAAAWLALRQPHRRLATVGLSLAALLTAATVFGVAALARGAAGPVERQVFDRATGFPAVDFEVEYWSRDAGPRPRVPDMGAGDARRAGVLARGALPDRPRFDARAAEGLRPATVLYALLGRTVGFLPYCAPLVFALYCGLLAGGWRRVLLVGAAASFAVRAMLFPFDLGDERAALGPAGVGVLAPMCWFLVTRLSLSRILAAALPAALVLYPLWLRPAGSLQRQAPPAGALSRLLPQETTQRPGAEQASNLFVGGLWLRPIAGRITPFGEESIVVESTAPGSQDSRHGDGWVEFLVAWEARAGGGAAGQGRFSPARLDVVIERSARLEVEGAEVQGRRTLPSGRTAVELLLAAPLVRHRLWWSRGPVAVHRLRLSVGRAGDAPDAVHRLQLRPRRD